MGNSYALIAQESTYGTAPASGYWDLQVNEDTHKARAPFVITRSGMRRNAAAPRAAGRRHIDKGGEGTITVDGISNGLGILFRTAASTAASAVASGGTLAYEQIFTFTHNGPPLGRSVTTEWYRDQEDGDYDWYQYRGGRCMQLDYGVGLDELLVWGFQMDYIASSRLTVDPARTPVTVEPDTVFSWADPTITLTPLEGGGGAAECLQSVSGSIPTGIDVDRWCLKKGTNRHQPARNKIVEPTGSLTWKYQTPTYYDAFKDGDQFSLSILFEGDEAIEDTTVPSVEILHPCIEFVEPNDPQASVDDSTMQDLPFVVLDDETNPHTTITVITSDTAL